MKNDQESPDSELDLPEVVRSGLKSRYGPVPEVPSEIDRAILADARQHFEQSRGVTRRLLTRRRFSAWQWTAIATTISAACVAFAIWKPQQSGQPTDVSFAMNSAASADAFSSDVDLNGRVDILDAFAMARQIRDGDSRARDINHDGRFDHLDIDVVAREAVKL